MVERLGRYSRTLQPGMTIVVPFIDRVKPLIDLREQVVAFQPQPVITEDNLVVQIDTVLYFTITDPKASSYEIANPLQAIEQLTVTTLRNLIGGMTLEDSLTSRDKINTQLRVVLDEATGKWGIRINRVELKSVDPPATIQEAMEKQMRAERDKRAAILNAEGVKQSQILTAEGAKQAAILRAEGEAQAVQTVFNAIHEAKPDEPLLRWQYPADAAAARGGGGQQGVRHPRRVHAGLGRWRPTGARRRRARCLRPAGADARRPGPGGRRLVLGQPARRGMDPRRRVGGLLLRVPPAQPVPRHRVQRARPAQGRAGGRLPRRVRRRGALPRPVRTLHADRRGRRARARPWDYAFLPPGAAHTLVGASDEPCVVVMASSRTATEPPHYPVSETARRHGAGVETATDDSAEAFAGLGLTFGAGRAPGSPRLPWDAPA